MASGSSPARWPRPWCTNGQLCFGCSAPGLDQVSYVRSHSSLHSYPSCRISQILNYVTNKSKRWSVLLDKTRIESLYEEARQYIPRGISQFWLLEKRYSTHRPRGKDVTRRTQNRAPANPRDSSRGPDRQGGTGRTLVVLREPEPVFARQSDILSYHFDETEAVTAAESYTRRHRRRAVVGMLLWDEAWW